VAEGRVPEDHFAIDGVWLFWQAPAEDVGQPGPWHVWHQAHLPSNAQHQAAQIIDI